MTIQEQKNKIGSLLGEPVVNRVQPIKKNDGLFEKKATTCSKILITEDNKLLLTD